MKKDATKTIVCKPERRGVGTEAGTKKQYLKCRPACKVTFKLPKEAATGAKKVTVVGDFNDWNPDAMPLKKARDGSFSITLEMECGRQYRFRYLIDATRWENDWSADRYEPNPFGGEDSVLEL
jgi:1,4-alpha-glucan branching enzyme